MMGREELPEGQGMLFDYCKPLIIAHWMKETKIPLSIGFFDKKRRLFQIEDMYPAENQDKLPTYKSKYVAQYALEVPLGWFKKHRIEPGATFEWSE